MWLPLMTPGANPQSPENAQGLVPRPVLHLHFGNEIRVGVACHYRRTCNVAVAMDPTLLRYQTAAQLKQAIDQGTECAGFLAHLEYY